jgi:hypothetical protein
MEITLTLLPEEAEALDAYIERKLSHIDGRFMELSAVRIKLQQACTVALNANLAGGAVDFKYEVYERSTIRPIPLAHFRHLHNANTFCNELNEHHATGGIRIYFVRNIKPTDDCNHRRRNGQCVKCGHTL